MRPTLLTLRGKTMSIADWSRQPGSVGNTTIHHRLLAGWDPERAVFEPSRKTGRPKMHRVDERVRITGINRASRAMTERHQRPEVILAPNPRVANPFPPTWGGFSSWPLESLPLLRRCA